MKILKIDPTEYCVYQNAYFNNLPAVDGDPKEVILSLRSGFEMEESIHRSRGSGENRIRLNCANGVQIELEVPWCWRKTVPQRISRWLEIVSFYENRPFALLRWIARERLKEKQKEAFFAFKAEHADLLSQLAPIASWEQIKYASKGHVEAVQIRRNVRADNADGYYINIYLTNGAIEVERLRWQGFGAPILIPC